MEHLFISTDFNPPSPTNLLLGAEPLSAGCQPRTTTFDFASFCEAARSPSAGTPWTAAEEPLSASSSSGSDLLSSWSPVNDADTPFRRAHGYASSPASSTEPPTPATPATPATPFTPFTPGPDDDDEGDDLAGSDGSWWSFGPPGLAQMPVADLVMPVSTGEGFAPGRVRLSSALVGTHFIASPSPTRASPPPPVRLPETVVEVAAVKAEPAYLFGPPPLVHSDSEVSLSTADCASVAMPSPKPRKRVIGRSSTPSSKRVRSDKPYACPRDGCTRRFVNKLDLVRHDRTHTGERPFSCTECDKRFRQTATLRVHMRIHSGEKPYGCTLCGKHFRHRNVCTDHEKRCRRKKERAAARAVAGD